MEAFAALEDQIARVHEDLATRRSDRCDEFRRTAEEARASARRAREIVRNLAQ